MTACEPNDLIKTQEIDSVKDLCVNGEANEVEIRSVHLRRYLHVLCNTATTTLQPMKTTLIH